MKFIKFSSKKITQFFWNARGRLQFALMQQPWPKHLNIKGSFGMTNLGKIEIGMNVTIVNSSAYNRAGVNHPTQLVAAKGACLKIGSNVGISGASIICHECVEIGNHVLLGANVAIHDSDLHPINYLERRSSGKAKSAPIYIEDDVWLCANVVVLKGVRIGARSIVAANSVVTKDIEPDTIAAGVPAVSVGSTK